MKKYPHLMFVIVFVVFAFDLVAQPTEQRVKVIVAPDHSNWTYKQNEKINFSVTVLEDGNPIKDVKIKYQVGLEKLEPTISKENVTLQKGTLSIEAGSSFSSPT